MLPRECSALNDCFVPIKTSPPSWCPRPCRQEGKSKAGRRRSRAHERRSRKSEKISMAVSHVRSLEEPQSKYERLLARAKEVPPAITLVVHPCDESSLRAAIEAADVGIIVPILVGPAARIGEVAREHRLDISRFEIVDAGHSEAAAAKAVQLVHEAKGELLMKGSLHTDELMRA